MIARDARFLFAYIIPVGGIIALFLGAYWLWMTIIIAYLIIPSLEMILPRYTSNFSEDEEKNRITQRFFDVLLHINVLLVYGALAAFLYNYGIYQWSGWQLFAAMFSLAIVFTTSGINVGHELGHKADKFSQFCSKALYLPSLYMHFFIEHNRGHHKRVATPDDPATSRLNEPLYLFWIRSVSGGYMHAWELENARVKKQFGTSFHLRNEMIQYHIIQFLYVLVLVLFFGSKLAVMLCIVAIISFLQLETVNYIEHYGLMRKKLESGRYENVKVTHSWNSNHELGRIMLYELTRHSDHHYKASRKYQVLRHFDESPQLPLGYPGSMLLSMIPPIWFRVMNPLVARYNG